MQIRPATPHDTPAITNLLLHAMQDIIFTFIGENDPAKAHDFMKHFVKTDGNQYSYTNCWVAELNGEVVGAVNVYDGAHLHTLRIPVIEYIRDTYGRSFPVGDETQAGEYYIDTLGVDENFRGQGIGSAILQFLIDEYVHRRDETLGLLVDSDNTGAKRLYERLGFKVVNEKQLFGKRQHHLQISRH